MAVEKFGSKTDTIVKLVLVFFVCLLSFSIGTFVGKKFSDNQHKLAKFEPTHSDREVASVDPHSGDVKPNDALTDDEVAKLAEEFVADENGEKPGAHGEKSEEGFPTMDKNMEGTHTAMNDEEGHKEAAPAPEHGSKAPASVHEENPDSEAPAHATGHAPAHAPAHAPEKAMQAEPSPAQTTSVKPSGAAEKVARGEAPVKEMAAKATVRETASRIPSSLPKEISGSAIGKYTVQVASYPEEEEAKKMASELKSKGFSAFYVSAKLKDRKAGTDKTWYRVSVGLFETKKEADAYKNDLLARSKVTSAIVQQITE